MEGVVIELGQVLRAAVSVRLRYRHKKLQGPCRERPQQLGVTAQEHAEVVRHRAHQEVEKGVTPAVRRDADWQLVWKMSDGNIRRVAEYQARQRIAFETSCRQKMGHLVGLGPEPAKLPVSDYVVKDHQALNGPTERHPFAKANVALLDGFVQRRVVDVKDAGLVVPAPIGRCELAARQFV